MKLILELKADKRQNNLFIAKEMTIIIPDEYN